MDSDAGVTVTEEMPGAGAETVMATVVVTEAAAKLAVAAVEAEMVMVAAPGATAVMSPLPDPVATAGALEV
jgi:hypothetical protein